MDFLKIEKLKTFLIILFAITITVLFAYIVYKDIMPSLKSLNIYNEVDVYSEDNTKYNALDNTLDNKSVVTDSQTKIVIQKIAPTYIPFNESKIKYTSEEKATKIISSLKEEWPVAGDDIFIRLELKSGKVYGTYYNYSDGEDICEYEKEKTYEVSGLSKKVLGIYVSAIGNGFPCAALCIMEDGSICYLDMIEKGIVAKEISGVSNVIRFETRNINIKNGSGYIGIFAILADNTIIEISDKIK